MAEPDRTNADAERVSDIVAGLRASVVYYDKAAAMVSNMRQPRTDNDNGLAAGLFEAAADIIEALSKALAEARMGKPLEWRKIGHQEWMAATPFAGIIISVVEDARYKLSGLVTISPRHPLYLTFDEAKAAAQADYQHRLLCALLTPTPENPNG